MRAGDERLADVPLSTTEVAMFVNKVVEEREGHPLFKDQVSPPQKQ
jgi:hypothetical protein